MACSFTLVVSGGKIILSNLTNIQEPEPHVFGRLEPEPLGKNTRSWSRLGKKSGAGAGAARKKSVVGAGAGAEINSRLQEGCIKVRPLLGNLIKVRDE